MSSNLGFSEFKFSEFHLTIFIVLNCFDFSTFRVFQYEAELTSFQLTAFEFLSEVEFDFNWNWVDTFFSWFFWFFNFLRRWVVVVHNLCCCIFDVYSTFNVCFNSGWDIEFIVATKLEFSCVDDLCIVCVSKWLSEASFKSCGHHTIFNLNVELVCHISTSYWIVSLDSWSIYINLRFIEVIRNTYWLDVILVVSVELSSIKPYLIVELSSTLNSLGIDVFCFVIWSSIYIWICICFTIFISQLCIIIEKLVISNWELSCIQYILLWLELRLFWRSHSVIELFVSWFSYVSNQCFCCSVVWYCYSYFCLHSIVSDSCVCTFHLCYRVSVSTFLILLVFKGSDFFTSFICVLYWREFNLTICIVGCSRNHNIVAVFQLECKFASFKLTTFQTFCEVEFCSDWYTVHTFLSWFFWSFYRFAYWVVYVNDLVGFVFDVYSTCYWFFNSCWDIEFVVATKCKFSGVDNLSVISIT